MKKECEKLMNSSIVTFTYGIDVNWLVFGIYAEVIGILMELPILIIIIGIQIVLANGDVSFAKKFKVLSSWAIKSAAFELLWQATYIK